MAWQKKVKIIGSPPQRWAPRGLIEAYFGSPGSQKRMPPPVRGHSYSMWPVFRFLVTIRVLLKACGAAGKQAKTVRPPRAQGDSLMVGTRRVEWVCVPALVLAVVASASRCEDRVSARERALALNNLTGGTSIKAEIKALTAKPEEGKQVLAAAVAMAKEKEQPFNYNAALVLGTASSLLKDTSAAQTFFLICLEQAIKLKSDSKVEASYAGLAGVSKTLAAAQNAEASEALWKEVASIGLRNLSDDASIRSEIDTILSKPGDARTLVSEGTRIASGSKKPLHFSALWLLGTAALQMKNTEDARTIFILCLEEAAKQKNESGFNRAFSGLLKVSELLRQNKKYDEEAQTWKRLLELGIRSLDVLRQYMMAVLNEASNLSPTERDKKYAEVRRIISEIKKVRPDDWRTIYIEALLEEKVENFDAAAKAYDEVLRLLSADSDIEASDKAKLEDELRSALASLYTDAKRYDKAAEECQWLLKAHPEEERYRRALVRALTLDHKMERAQEELKKLPKKGWENLELRGWFERETGDYTTAARTYEQLLATIGGDPQLDNESKKKLATDVHYMLSNVYVEANAVDKAAQQLQMLLKEKPDDPGYNNDLGYIWADHDMNLLEAEKMIRKAIDEDRKQQREKESKKGAKAGNAEDNSAYLDSLGWVLFKLKRYHEAKPLLEKATQAKDGQHVEIFDHLGEVHMALGEKSQAIDAWQQGVKVAGPSHREQERKLEVEKKLKQAEAR
jgi:predicted negative regulator of RcsB-dependent stress response